MWYYLSRSDHPHTG